jgi:nucleoid-associated protein YgaU
VDASGGPVAGATYKVVRGDMLSQIALQVYGDASKFRMIQAANPSLRNKPNRILADQVIFIPADKR